MKSVKSLLTICSLFAGVAMAVAHGTNQHTHAATYRGRAVVLQGTVLSNTFNVSDTGNLSLDGVIRETTLLNVTVPSVATATLAKALTEGADAVTYSEATVKKLNLTLAANSIKADLIAVRVSADCCTNVPEVRKESQIVGLVVNNQAIEVTGSPNQEVPLIGGVLLINETTSATTATKADISLTALHLILTNIADIRISSAIAGVTCEEVTTNPPPPTSSDS